MGEYIPCPSCEAELTEVVLLADELSGRWVFGVPKEFKLWCPACLHPVLTARVTLRGDKDKFVLAYQIITGAEAEL